MPGARTYSTQTEQVSPNAGLITRMSGVSRGKRCSTGTLVVGRVKRTHSSSARMFPGFWPNSLGFNTRNMIFPGQALGSNGLTSISRGTAIFPILAGHVLQGFNEIGRVFCPCFKMTKAFCSPAVWTPGTVSHSRDKPYKKLHIYSGSFMENFFYGV
jgi:hypothetical protein